MSRTSTLTRSRPSTTSTSTFKSSHSNPHHPKRNKFLNMIITLCTGESGPNPHSSSALKSPDSKKTSFLSSLFTTKHSSSKHAGKRLPTELYAPIIAHVQSRKDLLSLLLVDKAMSYEIMRVLYHSVLLSHEPHLPSPPFSSATTPHLVRHLKIVLSRARGGAHLRRCADLLPKFTRLESLEIRGRGWPVSTFDECRGAITGLKKLVLDGAAMDRQLLGFIALQRDLEELEINTPMGSCPAPEYAPDELEEDDGLNMYFPALAKLSITNTTSTPAFLSRSTPNLKHLRLSFDLAATPMELLQTIQALSTSCTSLESLILNTIRRDLIAPVLPYLPPTLKTLSTLMVQNEQPKLVESLTRLNKLENLLLHVSQPTVPFFVNPFADSRSPLEIEGGGGTMVTDEFVTDLRRACISLRHVEVDEQVFARRNSSWTANDLRAGLAGAQWRRESVVTIARGEDGPVQAMWRGL